MLKFAVLALLACLCRASPQYRRPSCPGCDNGPDIVEMVHKALSQVNTDEKLDEIVDVQQIQDIAGSKYTTRFRSVKGHMCEISWTDEDLDERFTPRHVRFLCDSEVETNELPPWMEDGFFF